MKIMAYVKCIVGAALVLASYGICNAQHDLGVRGNGNSNAYDSIYIPVNHQDSLWLNMEDGDSLRIERYRGRTFVDSVTEIWSTNDLNPAGMSAGIWLKPLRASDGSGNTGQYTIFLAAWRNGAYDGTRARSLTYTYDVRPYNIYDTINSILDTLQNQDNWIAKAESLTLMKTFLLDSIIAHTIGSHNLVTNPSFEEGTANWTLTGAGGAANSVTGADDKHGRKHLQLVGGSVTTTFDSDTIQLLAGQYVSFGALSKGGSASTNIQFVRDGGTVIASAQPVAGIFSNVWDYATNTVKIPASDEYFLRFTVATGVTSEFDGAFVVPQNINQGSTVMDTVFATNAGGGCTVGSQFIYTLYFHNTTSGSAIPNPGFLITNLSGSPLITWTANSNGRAVVTFDAGTYLIWPSFTAGINWTDRPDTFVVAGAGQIDTVRGTTATQLLPAVAGKTNVYGYLQNIMGDSAIGDVEIDIGYQFKGPVRCCTADSLVHVIPSGSSFTIFNSGRFEANLYPSSQLVPNTDYIFVFKRGNKEIKRIRFTVPTSGPAPIR